MADIPLAPWGPPPDDEAIEAIARATIARLPEGFRRHLEGVVLRVEAFASDAVLDALGIDDAFALTGLYTGLPIGQKSVEASGALPDMIQLFRRPLLDEWAETGVDFEALVGHVVIHEIGHHFGLSDADMAALEAAAG
ncbi:metallopeptidase family protein [Sphingomonas morindae]|uniref:Metallopeptidase family protein n=1 Tax=Sphingomonas morindae TaxID=1541170 RepID=A0ABY4X8X3_9SPHN|nr:metallopeptidase family protein [Sphingomonas morindae]USI73387.1 metallopeptidase family protein [Sphingomonas morindae]